MIPDRFFVTSGKATDPVSQLNAFDLALMRAKIAQCNITTVSSILPPNAKEVRRRRLPIGAITFVVMARMDGNEGETIGAGIAWGIEKNEKYGIVAEAHGYMDLPSLREILEWKIEGMAKNRGIEVVRIKHRIEILKIPMDQYGSVVSALVFLP